MSNSIKEAWDGYVKQCMPEVPHPIQYTETRRAFYGGAGVALSMSKNPQLAISLAYEIKEFLRQEVERFENVPATEEAPIDPETNRKVAVDYLRCQATGYDDASCNEVLNTFDEARDVAKAMFAMLQKIYSGNNHRALQCTLLSIHAFISLAKLN